MIKFLFARLTFCLFVAALVPIRSLAQDEARALWQVTNFDITVNSLSERALSARAVLAVRNVGRGAGSTLTLRINAKAEVKNINIGNATASYRSQPEPRGNAQRLTIVLPGSVAANESVVATVEYRLPVDENSGLAAISPVGSQFLPLSLWYPMPNTSFAVRGADYAPFRLTVNAPNALSSGTEKSTAGNSSFEQTLNAQPFFVIGNWDRVDGQGNAKAISAYLPKGTVADERKQAETLIALAADAVSFYAAMFGPAPDVPIRLVATKRGAGFDDAGTILVSEGAFRRNKVDAATALGIAEAVARIWIGGATPVRGEGNGVVREGMVRFLATLFLEKQFGAEAAAEERSRERLAYAAIAKRDAPLSRTTPQEPIYFNSVANKGAMVWRLIDHLVGREQFVTAVRGLLSGAKTDTEGFSLARARAMLVERGGAPLKEVIDQEFDQPTDMDLLMGLPQQQGAQWTAALRNLGSFAAKVNVAGTTSTGQRLLSQVTIPPHDFGQVTFQTASKIVQTEVDPEKFYPQLDYSNDAAPRTVEVVSSLGEAMRLFGTRIRKAEATPGSYFTAANAGSEYFWRVHGFSNKIDEAEREFRQLADEKFPTAATLAWVSVGLGEISLRRGQPKDAARFFTEAVRADAEYASTLAARAARVRTEAAGGSPPIDESAATFIGQLDAAIRSGRQNEIAPMVVPGELARFIRGAVGTQPEIWQTRVLRTEQLDANQIAVDVAMQTKQLGVEHSGTAVFILARVGGAWKLNAIEFFEVR